MENAGAIWKDEAVVTDGHIISARRPPDLPPYGKAFAMLWHSKAKAPAPHKTAAHFTKKDSW